VNEQEKLIKQEEPSQPIKIGREAIVPILYLLVTGVCLGMALFVPPENEFWIKATSMLTLPGSVISAILMVFVAQYFPTDPTSAYVFLLAIPALLNAYILGQILNGNPRKRVTAIG
jgi:hypothetical protein